MSTTTLQSAAPFGSSGYLAALLRTEASVTPLIARLVLGLVMLPHGAQKLLGWFGGYGFEGTMGFLTGQAGLPWIVAFLVIVIEFFGGLALILGAASRLAALGVIAVMTGAIVTTHASNGFFMNWSGQQGGEGFEYHLLAIALSLVVLVAGSGKASVDRAIAS
jgi:putative oxidoreductase